MNSKTMGSNFLLGLAALIWGVAFVAQSVGMEYVGPFTFNACRFVLGGVVLIPCIFMLRKGRQRQDGRGRRTDRVPEPEELKNGIVGGICCGTALFVASSFQQIGIAYTTVGKAGFITALYIVIVPLLGIFLRKKVAWSLWLSVALAVAGMYLLCMTDGLNVNRGDILVFLCAVCFSFHILVIDYFSPKADGVVISCVQFFTAGFFSGILTFLFETPDISAVLAAWMPIAYAGIMSCGVAYTLQVVGQKNTEPVVASLILSLESVFSLLAGWVILGQKLLPKEQAGCVLVFCAIVLAQIPVGRKR